MKPILSIFIFLGISFFGNVSAVAGRHSPNGRVKVIRRSPSFVVDLERDPRRLAKMTKEERRFYLNRIRDTAGALLQDEWILEKTDQLSQLEGKQLFSIPRATNIGMRLALKETIDSIMNESMEGIPTPETDLKRYGSLIRKIKDVVKSDLELLHRLNLPSESQEALIQNYRATIEALFIKRSHFKNLNEKVRHSVTMATGMSSSPQILSKM